MHTKIIQKSISSHSSREQIATKGSTREVYENVVKNNSKQLNSTTINMIGEKIKNHGEVPVHLNKR